MLNALSVFNLLHCWQRGKIFQVSNSKIPHCKNIECCHANKVIHRVWKCPSHVKIGLKQRNDKKIWTWILFSCGRAKHFKTNSHINPKPYLLREMVNHYQCSFLMKPEEHTSHCAGDISLQKQKYPWWQVNFLIWVTYDVMILYILHKKGHGLHVGEHTHSIPLCSVHTCPGKSTSFLNSSTHRDIFTSSSEPNTHPPSPTVASRAICNSLKHCSASNWYFPLPSALQPQAQSPVAQPGSPGPT